VRARLPHQLIELVTTPLPAALPAPAAMTTSQIIIPTIVLPMAIPTATNTAVATPTSTNANPQATAANSATPAPTDTPTITPAPTATEVPLPTAVRLEGITVIPQKFNNCGPTNLTINLNYYGRATDQLAVADVIKPNYDDRNVSPSDIEFYVRQHTDMAITIHAGGDLGLLKRLLAAGYPVVVEKGLIPSESEAWMGHYLTVFGYDDATQEFATLDTFLGPWDSSGLMIEYDDMMEYWRHFNYTFYVIYPPEQATAVTQLLTPTMTDPLAMWQHALQQAQTDIAAKPDDAFAWFNLGTNLTELGKLTGDETLFASAVAAYDQARTIGLPWRMLWYQFGPYEAYLGNGRTDDVFTLAEAMLSNFGGQNVEETYFYRGQARLASGDINGAAADFRTALQLYPNYTTAQVALDNTSN
jgi:hypothetical protein